jgi:vacuolar-type H+-ATPase subunit E/Vma4
MEAVLPNGRFKVVGVMENPYWRERYEAQKAARAERRREKEARAQERQEAKEARAQERLEAQGISIKSTADAQDLLSSLELIEEKISAMSESSINIEVKGNVSKALSDFNSISSVIDALPDSKNVSVLVKTSGVSELSNISSLLSGLKDKTVNVKVNVSQNGSFPFKADGDDNFSGGPVLINDGEPVNGSSAELVVSNNKAHIYNNGEPTVVNLPKGSKIFNAKDTQNILNSNKDLEFPAFQNGNVSYENDGYKDLFDKWLEGKKYLLALNLITEEKYYKDLEDMNEKYLSNIEEAQADYWKHQEEIYKWKTSQIDSQNDSLKEQLELEKSLKGVIGAHSNKVLVYKNGTFQYISDIDAIDSAKRSFYKLNDEAKEKSQYSINLGGSGAKVTDNTILKNDYQEIKKMLQDVKYDDLNAVEWGKKESVKQENYTFSIDNLSLPNAKDAAGILSGLKNYAYQYSYG